MSTERIGKRSVAVRQTERTKEKKSRLPKSSRPKVGAEKPSVKSKRLGDLVRDLSKTSSDPRAGREVIAKQVSAASKLLGKKSTFEELEVGGGRAGGENTDPRPEAMVDDPTQQEQSSDIESHSDFEVGSDVSTPPDFESKDLVEEKTLGTGETVSTYSKAGVTYTETKLGNGSVSTNYEIDGVKYNNVSYSDGHSNTYMTAEEGDVSYSRTVTLDSEGNASSDESTASKRERDPESGEYLSQTRTEEKNSDGELNTTEEITRPDGGKSTYTVTERPDPANPEGGMVTEEHYLYEGDQGSLERKTNTMPDGSSSTESSRSYTSDKSIEELSSGAAESLPEAQRDPTVVTEVEKTTTSGPGAEPEVQFSETQYSQTSHDVVPRDSLPEGVAVDESKTGATTTWTEVQNRDPETGELKEASSSTFEVKVAGTRENGEEVSATSIKSVGSDGTKTETFDVDGYTRAELRTSIGPTHPNAKDDRSEWALVGGSYHQVLPKEIDGKHPDEHLRDKGDTPSFADGGDAIDFLGVRDNRDEPIDIEVSTTTDKDGNKIESVTWDNTDQNSDGRVVTRVSAGDNVQWTYKNTTDGGNDVRTQTVVEGSGISTYNHYQKTGDGTFVMDEETTMDGQTMATKHAEREQITSGELDQMVKDGTLSETEKTALMQGGEPYYLESTKATTVALVNDDATEYIRDEDGNIIQSDTTLNSTTVTNKQNYSVGHSSYEDKAKSEIEEMHSVADPNGSPPVRAEFKKYDLNGDDKVLKESQNVKINAEGEYILTGEDGNEEVIGELDLQGNTVHNYVKEEGSLGVSQLLSPFTTSVDEFSDFVSNANWGSSFDKIGKAGKGLSAFGSVATATWGASQMVNGLMEGDAYTAAQGVAGTASGAMGTLTALQSLGGGSSWSQSLNWLTETRVGVGLNALAGGVGIGIGFVDLMNAESGYDQAAAGMSIGAGFLAAATPFFPPAAIGAVVLGLGSVFVSRGDMYDTADIDPRIDI
jgi:hypothetical protein